MLGSHPSHPSKTRSKGEVALTYLYNQWQPNQRGTSNKLQQHKYQPTSTPTLTPSVGLGQMLRLHSLT